MNFKRFGRTANLFDEANLEGGVYLVSNGNKYGSIINGVRSGVKINVLPNTQYTLSLYSNMNISIRILQWSGETYITQSPKYNVSGNVSLTITTNSTTDKIAFNVEGVNGQYAENLMLNVGETALPYQLYKDWTDIPHYIMGTSTDTITTLPAVLYPNDTTATVGLKGNMEQSGTPTPQNPIQPQSCGERTGNLINIYANNTSNGYVNNALLKSNDSTYRPSSAYISEYFPIEDNKTYTYYTGGMTGEAQAVCFYNAAKKYISGISYDNQTAITFTTPQGTKYYRCTVMRTANDTESYKKTMLNTGSTALPYEPYGYKIPILSNSQTTNVYLGEVQTTRRIKKYEFTGSETWNVGSENFYSLVPETSGDGVPYSSVICSHCSGSTINSTGKALFVKKSEFPNITTGAELKQFCEDQYAAGTPVTVWYILAESTTGIVNEPLRKIGDYADEVSGITIPTIAGANTLSIGTTLQPSEVTVNYKGWHPVADVHEADNGAWT